MNFTESQLRAYATGQSDEATALRIDHEIRTCPDGEVAQFLRRMLQRLANPGAVGWGLVAEAVVEREEARLSDLLPRREELSEQGKHASPERAGQELWIRLFRHIPPEHQSKFTLITSNGTELLVQSFIRIEPEFVLVKGRLSGSQDAGRVFFIPYANIDSFSYTNPVRDNDVEELFGSLTFDAPQPAEPHAADARAAANPAVQPGAGARHIPVATEHPLGGTGAPTDRGAGGARTTSVRGAVPE
jgi:hypothetical protein